MRKRFVYLLVAVLLLLTMCIPAQAAEPRALTVKPVLSFNSTTATCTVTIIDAGKYINATLELWNGTILVDSWSGTGTSAVTITGSCTVTKGVTYSLRVRGTSGGVTINCATVRGTC